MKIINIMLASGKGGLEQMSTIYAKALVDLNYDTTCILMNNSPYKIEAIKYGAKLKLLKSRSKYNLINTYNLIKFIKQENADIVICHGNRAMSLVLNKFIKILLKTKFKTIGVIHSKKCPYKNQCDYLLFLTDSFKQSQLQKIQNKSFVLPNTVLDNSVKIKHLEQPITFGSLGRLHHIKGYDILLSSLAILKNKGYDFKFVLGGDGPDKDNILQQIKDLKLENIIKYIGWVKNKKAFYSQIDIFCLPSRYETMSLTILEALAYSKAIISTDLQGPTSVLKQLSTPLIAKTEDAKDFSSKMEFLLKNKNEIQKMAKEGNNLFNNKYNLDCFKNRLDLILIKISIKINKAK